MSSKNHLGAVREAVYSGDLGGADALLGATIAADLEASVLRAEILLLRGFTARAAKLADDLLPRTDRNEALQATALFVAGICALELGDRKRGTGLLDRAEILAKE